MRKKICFTLIIMMFIWNLCSCGKDSDKTSQEMDNHETASVIEDKNKASETAISNAESDVIQDDENVDSDLLAGTYKVPLHDIYVDIPNYNLIEEGYTRLFFESGQKYVTFTCLYEEVCDNITTAHEKTIDIFMKSVYDHHFVNNVEVRNDTTVMVNNIETYQYEGIVVAGREELYDAYLYGYSFVFEGFPCSIVGVVIDREQPEEEQQLVKEIVDEMMKSVRNSN